MLSARRGLHLYPQRDIVACPRRPALLLMAGATAVWLMGAAAPAARSAVPELRRLSSTTAHAGLSGMNPVPSGAVVEGSLTVDGVGPVPWRLALPSPTPPEGFPLGLVLTHGSTGDLSKGELPLYASAAARVGVPCLRFTCTSQEIPQRTKAMEELMLSAPRLHPALRNTSHWVVGGRSLGARTAATVAAELSGASVAARVGGSSAKDAAEAVRRARQANISVVGAVLSAWPVHPPEDTTHIRDTPVKSLQLPLLMLRGTADPHGQNEVWAVLRSRLTAPDLTVVEIPGGDHWLKPKGEAEQKAAEERIAAVLQAFLKRLKARVAAGGGGGAGGRAVGEKKGLPRRAGPGAGRPGTAPAAVLARVPPAADLALGHRLLSHGEMAGVAA